MSSVTQLFVGNLPWKATDDEVRYLFESNGVEVERIQLMRDVETGRPMGYGFVTVSMPQNPEIIIEKIHGRLLNGRSLIVERTRGVQRAT